MIISSRLLRKLASTIISAFFYNFSVEVLKNSHIVPNWGGVNMSYKKVLLLATTFVAMASVVMANHFTRIDDRHAMNYIGSVSKPDTIGSALRYQTKVTHMDTPAGRVTMVLSRNDLTMTIDKQTYMENLEKAYVLLKVGAYEYDEDAEVIFLRSTMMGIIR